MENKGMEELIVTSAPSRSLAVATAQVISVFIIKSFKSATWKDLWVSKSVCKGQASTGRKIVRSYSPLNMPKSASVSFSNRYCSGNKRFVLFNFFESWVHGRPRRRWFVTGCNRAGQPARAGVGTEGNCARGCSTPSPVVQRLLHSLLSEPTFGTLSCFTDAYL